MDHSSKIDPSGWIRSLNRLSLHNRLLSRLIRLLALTSVGSVACLSAWADVIPDTNQSLGSVFSCRDRGCAISGGTSRGSNLFHRFSQFDTRSNVAGPITIVNGPDSKHVIIAILSPAYIDTRISPVNRASLYFMAPQGIAFGKGASLANVNTLLVTTASRLSLGLDSRATFDVFSTTQGQLLDSANTAFSESPAVDFSLIYQQLREGDAEGGEGFFADSDHRAEMHGDHVGISVGSGVVLEVEKSMIIVSNRSPIVISALTEPTVLSAQGLEGSADFQSGDGVAIVGQMIDLHGTDGHHVELRANSQIVVREPAPWLTFPDGELASGQDLDVVHAGDGAISIAFEGDELLQAPSQITIKNVDFMAASQPSESWRMLLQASGLGCELGTCDVGMQTIIIDGVGNNSVRIATDSELIAPTIASQPLPDPSSSGSAPSADPRPAGPLIPLDSFDQFQVVVDQTVAEDFEATSTATGASARAIPAGSAAPLLTVQLLPVPPTAPGPAATGAGQAGRDRELEK